MNPSDVTLAELVEQRPSLWDKRIKDYHLRPVLKNRWWQEIADELEVEVSEVKKRWRNIRDYYRHLKSARSAASGSAAMPLTQLQVAYMRYLSFLDPVLEPKATSTSLDQTDTSFDGVFEERLAEDLAASPARPSSAAGQDAASAGEPSIRQPTEPTKLPKRRKRSAKAADDDTLEDEIRAAMRKQTSSHGDFLASLIPLLDRLGEEDCARFKLKIFTEATNLAYP